MAPHWLSGISSRGKPLIATSWMGLDIRDQEPYLGENPGFISSETASNDRSHFTSLFAHYMQNGSLGRRVDIEIRAYDDGVAFRYILPRSTPLEEILIRDEATEFNFAQPGALSHLDARPDFELPFVFEEPGVGWVAIIAAGPELSIREVSEDLSNPDRRRHVNQSGAEHKRTQCRVRRSHSARLAVAGGDGSVQIGSA